MKLYDFDKKQIIDLKNKSLNFYLCGPTVYDDLHIGNMRSIILYDQFTNALNALKIKHKYVLNITDIDDKIIKKAISSNKTELEVSTFYYEEFKKLLKSYNLKSPTHNPKVTEHLQGIIDFINELVMKDLAYVVDGNVFFEIKKCNNYGSTVNLNVDELETEDKEFIHLKKDAHDFVLWKKTSEGILFDSPWGKGRPGWHTECSYFIYKFFNKKTIDIHSGGIDLRFPHHVNEKAQFESLLEIPMTKAWNYVGHVMFDNEKMSKSLGNIFKAKDFESQYSSNILKNIFISTKYSKPVDISLDTINTSKLELEKWEKSLLSSYIKIITNTKFKKRMPSSAFIKEVAGFVLDDFNLLNVKEVIISKIKEISNQQEPSKVLFNEILFCLDLLGITFYLETSKTILKDFTLQTINKNYEVTDKIRKGLFKL